MNNQKNFKIPHSIVVPIHKPSCNLKPEVYKWIIGRVYGMSKIIVGGINFIPFI